ncbi:molybdopterin molybdotransferase MoeA [Planctomycetota bacterium]|nr:molybdopterin molybdotransferase MoeA [Planctomycetota bacterium]
MNSKNNAGSLLAYDTALQLISQQINPLEAIKLSIDQAPNRVLLEPVIADRDLPPFNRATMDGYAVQTSHFSSNKPYPILTDLPAGSSPPPNLDLTSGIISISTGAAVPPPYDAVIPIEQSSRHDRRVTFNIDSILPNQNMHLCASDASVNDILIKPHTLLTPHHLAIAASVGHTQLLTSQPIKIAILTTGNEVQDPNTPTAQLQLTKIRNTNLPMLTSLVHALHQTIVRVEHIPDDHQHLLKTFHDLLPQSDLIITAGSISVGQHDLLPNIFKELGYAPIFHGLAIQPGKPTGLFSPTNTGISQQYPLILALPGNPVSALATFHLLAWPIINRMTNLNTALPWRRVWSAEEIKPNPKRELFRAACYFGDAHDQIQLIPWHTSGDIVHTSTAHGFVRLPLRSQPVPPGSPLPFLHLLGTNQ